MAEIWLVQGQRDWFTDPKKIDILPRVMREFLNSLNTIDTFLTNSVNTKKWRQSVRVTVNGKNWPIESVYPALPGGVTKTNYVEIKLARVLSTYDVADLVVLKIKGFSPSVVYAYKATIQNFTTTVNLGLSIHPL